MAGKTINTSTKISRAKVFNKNFASGNKSSSGKFKNVSRNSFAGTSVDNVAVSASGIGIAVKLFGIILLLCIVSMLIQRFQGGEGIPSFQSLFNFLSGWNPPLQIPFLTFNSFTSQDWGILNFIKDLFVMLAQVLNVLVFFFNGLVTVISYVVVFFQWLFIF